MIRNWKKNKWCIPGKTLQSCFENLLLEIISSSGLNDVDCKSLPQHLREFEGILKCDSTNAVDILNSAVAVRLIVPDDIRNLKKMIEFLVRKKLIDYDREVKFLTKLYRFFLNILSRQLF